MKVTSDLLREALTYAVEKHEGQVRVGSGLPYVTHPIAVATSLQAAGWPDEVVAAGLLHDTVEDTDATIVDILERFGPRVAHIVSCVTHVEGDDRPYLTRIEQDIAADPDPGVAAVKLHDVRHNKSDLPPEKVHLRTRYDAAETILAARIAPRTFVRLDEGALETGIIPPESAEPST